MKTRDKKEAPAAAVRPPAPAATPAPAPVQPAPPKHKISVTVALEFSADELYMLIDSLGYMRADLKRSEFSSHRNRAWKYLHLAHRLDKEYIPLLDKTDEIARAREERPDDEKLRHRDSDEHLPGPGDQRA